MFTFAYATAQYTTCCTYIHKRVSCIFVVFTLPTAYFELLPLMLLAPICSSIKKIVLAVSVFVFLLLLAWKLAYSNCHAFIAHFLAFSLQLRIYLLLQALYVHILVCKCVPLSEIVSFLLTFHSIAQYVSDALWRIQLNILYLACVCVCVY